MQLNRLVYQWYGIPTDHESWGVYILADKFALFRFKATINQTDPVISNMTSYVAWKTLLGFIYIGENTALEIGDAPNFKDWICSGMGNSIRDVIFFR